MLVHSPADKAWVDLVGVLRPGKSLGELFQEPALVAQVCAGSRPTAWLAGLRRAVVWEAGSMGPATEAPQKLRLLGMTSGGPSWCTPSSLLGPDLPAHHLFRCVRKETAGPHVGPPTPPPHPLPSNTKQILQAHLVDYPFFTNFWPPAGGAQTVQNMLDGRTLTVSGYWLVPAPPPLTPCLQLSWPLLACLTPPSAHLAPPPAYFALTWSAADAGSWKQHSYGGGLSEHRPTGRLCN